MWFRSCALSRAWPWRELEAMALLKYFKKASVLPNANGLLSTSVPPSTIVSVNKEVKPLLDGQPSDSNGRGKYLVYTEEEKLKIAKRAAEMGVTNTFRHFKKDFSDRPLKESTVRTWMNKYKRELAERRRSGSDLEMKMLPSRKRGHTSTSTRMPGKHC